ncbi:hypothetical protein W97_01376 [Coniosporium apollinis CBS 100218]|uniref:DUF6594 domain-containing protein n=1 Tax=Coniosporium apollinis (strain CBS 100218) TaxID=1168221 RepID=R7YJR5_CONA1|nr:uncharacterized protein W97_01376 [Coniosporium apollinis CBS 100218]EON62157.1 hypothetical protein W97_01376 [Coniosporium apollinis CBS 100218]
MGEGSAADTAVELTDVQAKDIERGDPNPISPVSPSSTFAPPQRLPRRETHDSVCHGYPRLAHWVGREPSFAIFRRFATLNAKNILYLQAEIAYLELELDELERLNSDDCGSLQTHLQGLLSAPEGSSGHKQMQKMLEIRGKLKEYNHMLLEHTKLYRLPEPNPSDFAELRTHLDNHSPDGSAWLKVPEDVWELDEDSSTIHHDLVALSQRNVSTDHFTSWVIDWLVVHYAKLRYRFSRKKDGDFTEIDDRKINRAVGTFTTIFGSLLPTASVFALYYIHDTIWRLTFIMLFSCFFSTCLAVFTDARRIEIFAGAVALASVQVVFISTTEGGSYVEPKS